MTGNGAVETAGQPPRGQVFTYEGFAVDAGHGLLTCRYSLDGREFTERVSLLPGPAWNTPAARAAARLVYLLAGVSYYKTAAPPVIDLGGTPLSGAERDLLRDFYVDGLGEYAYRNNLDLSGLSIEARAAPAAPPPAAPPPAAPPPAAPPPAAPAPAGSGAGSGDLRPLIPFGGGIDSIVTVEGIRGRTGDAALFVVNRPGDRFDAIERPAAVSGLSVIRAGREIDPQLLRSAEFGFLNGHVPVTGIISAIAVLAATLSGRDAVVMSNEWSSSVPTLELDGRSINHQWSKSAAFEEKFRAVLRADPAGLPDYFSALRDRTELWVARRFAGLTQYHGTFRSCNRAFHIDAKRRLDHWCGSCDKCCFIDLILAPFMPAERLRAVFAADGGGTEPLENPELLDKFRALLDVRGKPFECVGEVEECRAAAVWAGRRADRQDGSNMLRLLAHETDVRPDGPEAEAMLRSMGDSFIPPGYSFAGA